MGHLLDAGGVESVVQNPKGMLEPQALHVLAGPLRSKSLNGHLLQ